MLIAGPSSASGGMIALTRLPSARRASTIGLVSSTRRPTSADDAVDDLPQMLVVAEANIRVFQAAAALDINLVEAVDQNIGDGRVLQQRLQRTEAEGLVHHLVHEAFLVLAA